MKDPKSGVFKGTAFVRYEKEEGATAALEASGGSNTDQNDSTFVSSKNIAVGVEILKTSCIIVFLHWRRN